MSIGPIVYLTTPSDTSTSQIAPVGTMRAYNHSTYGHQIYKSVKCGEAGVTEGIAVSYKSGTLTDEVVLPAGTNEPNYLVAGIAQNAIANASYGWVLVSGEGVGMATGTTSAEAALATSGAAGKITGTTPGAVEHCIFGSIVTGASADALARVRVRGLI